MCFIKCKWKTKNIKKMAENSLKNLLNKEIFTLIHNENPVPIQVQHFHRVNFKTNMKFS